MFCYRYWCVLIFALFSLFYFAFVCVLIISLLCVVSQVMLLMHLFFILAITYVQDDPWIVMDRSIGYAIFPGVTISLVSSSFMILCYKQSLSNFKTLLRI